ncbi:MAG TPA: hypothetical protein VMD53_15205 [Rhizomicrobium sp.]|nr:hypothetical protein [Rhizomicrobium sp.]
MKSAIRHSLVGAVFFALAASSTPGHAADAASKIHVFSLSQDETARLGIETVPARRATFTPQVRGYGMVISLAAIAQADFDYRTAEAAVTESRLVLQRAERLFKEQALSQQVVDTARHRATADMAQMVLADRREAALFGQNAPWRGPPRNEALIDNLASGKSTLIQATFPLGIAFASPPRLFSVARLDPQPGQTSWSSQTIWEGPADPAIPGRNFFAFVDHSDLALGEHVLVYAPVGAPVSGVKIPMDAVVLSEGKPWCYVEVSGQHFSRVPIDLRLELPDGYFVPQGIAPDQPVVVKGTGLLLAREFGSAIPGED